MFLYKFHRMKLTYKQMKNLLEYRDSWSSTFSHAKLSLILTFSYIRGIGLLYLRMCGDPKEIWDWYEPLLSDREEIFLSKDGRSKMYGVSATFALLL